MAGDKLLRKPQLSQTEPTVGFAGDLSGDNTAAVVAKIRGYEVQDTAPSDGQVLSWVNGNSRWEPIEPVATWDAIYGHDANGLDISTVNKPLTIEQTSTLGQALWVKRDLASASTDSSVIAFQNLASGDDQSTLYIANYASSATWSLAYGINLSTQSASSGGINVTSAVGVGTSKPQFSHHNNSGDTLWGVYADGHQYMATESAAAREVLELYQTDTDKPFIQYKGTSAGDETSSISTVNGSVADMVRVIVDAGSDNTRWVPCYSSATLPYTSWDAIYDNDADGLTVDTSDKPFSITQTSTSGEALSISRNLALASTNDPMVRITNSNAGDDQSALYIDYSPTSATWDKANAVHIKLNGAYSGGILIKSSVAPNAAKRAFMYTNNIDQGLFQVFYDGRVAMAGITGMARPLLQLLHLGTTDAFMEFTGTTGAGSTNSISSDCTDADMLKVVVDDGSSATRWIPAFTSTTGITPGGDLSGTIAAATVGKIQGNSVASGTPTTDDLLKWTGSTWDHVQPTWDWIYDADKTLDVDSTAVEFSKTSGTAEVFKVTRNQASATTGYVMQVTDAGASIGHHTLLAQTANASYACFAANNTAVSQTGQKGTAGAFVLTTNKRVRKKINIHNAVFEDDWYITSGREWTHLVYYVSGTTWAHNIANASSTNGSDYAHIPIDIPDGCSLLTLAVNQDGGGTTSSTGTNASFICLLTHASGSTAVESVRTYATDGTAQWIIKGAIWGAIDTTTNDYSIGYRGAITNRSTGCQVHGVYIEYDVTDVGQAAAT